MKSVVIAACQCEPRKWRGKPEGFPGVWSKVRISQLKDFGYACEVTVIGHVHQADDDM